MEDFPNRYITTEDPRADQVVYPLPGGWWSRPYEYAWAMQFAGPGQVVLDAGCGLEHPFKFWLAQNCAEVHAVDLDERLCPSECLAAISRVNRKPHLDEIQAALEKIEFYQADLARMPYPDAYFDRVFCISVVEHLAPPWELALREMGRVLKPDGKIVVTLDLFDRKGQRADILETFREQVFAAGLQFEGPLRTDLPENALFAQHFHLYIYRSLLNH